MLHVASPLGGGAAGDRNALVGPARDGTLRVLRAAVKAGVKRVVMTSAAATARPPLSTDRASDETVWADPDDPQFDAYRVSKILAERAAWDFMGREGKTTQLTTILPGAVFGPILSAENLGSVQIIDGMLKGKPPAMPRLGFWVVDVRDLADLHIRAMTAVGGGGAAVHRGRRIHVDGRHLQVAARAARRGRREDSNTALAELCRPLAAAVRAEPALARADAGPPLRGRFRQGAASPGLCAAPGGGDCRRLRTQSRLAARRDIVTAEHFVRSRV